MLVHRKALSLAEISIQHLIQNDKNMDTQKLKEDLQIIANTVILPDHIIGIIPRLSEGNITRLEVEKHCLDDNVYDTIAKVNFLQLIFEYINLALADNLLTIEEKDVISYLKKAFDIKPGDFLMHANQQIHEVLSYQFARIYGDNYITSDEILLKADLQQIFDLDFTSINKYSQTEAVTSLKLGAEIENLDVQFTHQQYFELKSIL